MKKKNNDKIIEIIEIIINSIIVTSLLLFSFFIFWLLSNIYLDLNNRGFASLLLIMSMLMCMTMTSIYNKYYDNLEKKRKNKK